MPTNNLIRANQVWVGGQPRTVGELCAQFAENLAQSPAPAGRLALVSNSALDLLAAAAWLAQSRRDGMVLPGERLTTDLGARLEQEGFQIISMNRPLTLPSPHPMGRGEKRRQAAALQKEGRITLLTSGTTGEPKLVEHTWQTLFTMAKARLENPNNWLLTYQPGTYAWFQMVTLWLFVPGQSLTICSERSPLALVEAARQNKVTAISATPTFWRLALLQIPAAELSSLPLQQITLGGERVDQAILDQLRQLYPKAALTHIYASTEAGACVVVRDGREGFPAAWLANAQTDSPQLQARDGYLWIRSPYAANRRAGDSPPYLESGWLNSRDRVEIRGDRAFILGRAEKAFISVGGAKVAAPEVEKILLQHPAILWCRVHGCPAPLVGELVGADVVFRSEDATVDEAALAQFCHERMPEQMVPRVWKFLKEIPVTDNLKTQLS